MNEPHNDLDWLAFCYAAGELGPAEAEQFEGRLAAEQPAREALARAVEVTQAVAVAESQPYGAVTVRARTNWAGRLTWMAVGGLASLLIAMLWSGSFAPPAKMAALNPAPQGNAEAQRSLAVAWKEAGAEIDSAKQDGSWPAIIATPFDGDSDPAPAPMPRGDEMVLDEAPSWMTTAVLGLAGVSPDDAETSEGPLGNE